ncbi:MAG: hypothetical protein U0527_13490 [Candidatus Eisenbacteria bacterium]
MEKLECENRVEFSGRFGVIFRLRGALTGTTEAMPFSDDVRAEVRDARPLIVINLAGGSPDQRGRRRPRRRLHLDLAEVERNGRWRSAPRHRAAGADRGRPRRSAHAGNRDQALAG